MRNFLIRAIVAGISITLTANLLPGIHVNNDIGSVLLIGLVFGLVNATVKPLLALLTCPFVILTLGLFILVINGLMIQLVAWLVGSAMSVDGFGWALVGGIVMSIITMILEGLLKLNDEPERENS